MKNLARDKKVATYMVDPAMSTAKRLIAQQNGISNACMFWETVRNVLEGMASGSIKCTPYRHNRAA